MSLVSQYSYVSSNAYITLALIQMLEVASLASVMM